MTVNVIDEFKAVQVNHHQRAVRLLANFLKLLFRRTFIEKSRELVCRRSLFQVVNLADSLHDVSDAAQNYFGLERLVNKIHRAYIEAAAFDFAGLVRRDEHERNFFMELVLQGDLHIVARHARHSEIRKHHVGFLLAIKLHCLFRRTRADCFVFVHKNKREHLTINFHIIDYQNFFHCQNLTIQKIICHKL